MKRFSEYSFYHILLLFVLLFTLLVDSVFSASKNIVDPQIIAQQEEIQRKMEESGYADIELDLLHEKVKGLLVRLKPLIKKDEKDNQVKVKFQIAYGESIKSISERYLYSGDIELFTDEEGKSLQRVKFAFRRHSPLGNYFKLEMRELENPTPNFTDKNVTLDKNDDMILRYFETTDDQKDFTKIDETTIGQIGYFPKRIALLETYKKYLRRAEKALNRQIYNMNLTDRVRVQKMIEFE